MYEPVNSRAWFHPRATSVKHNDAGTYIGQKTFAVPLNPFPQVYKCPSAWCRTQDIKSHRGLKQMDRLWLSQEG